MRRIATDSIERARRVREASPRNRDKGSSFGSDLTRHKGIASSKKNKKLRDLISRVNLPSKVKPTPISSPSAPATDFVPSSFADVYAALDFLTSDLSRSRPELLKITKTIKSELQSRDTELMTLRRLTASMQDQLTDQEETSSVELVATRRDMKELCALQEEMANGTRVLRKDLEVNKVLLRQKETEFVNVDKMNRRIAQELDDLRKAHAETEESCNDIVRRTTETAEEDRTNLKILKEELNAIKSGSRKEKTEHMFDRQKNEREVESLSEELRAKTLRTAMHALNRMKKYSIWKAFGKMKMLVNLQHTTNAISLNVEVEQLKTEKHLLAQQVKRMTKEQYVLNHTNQTYVESEKNMVGIISWMLDMHNGMLDDDQSHIFLDELRNVYQQKGLKSFVDEQRNGEDAENPLSLTVDEVGCSS